MIMPLFAVSFAVDPPTGLVLLPTLFMPMAHGILVLVVGFFLLLFLQTLKIIKEK